MALKIRLRQQGRNNRPFYRIVVMDVREPRDGKYLEMVGWYNPFEKEQTTLVKGERVGHWLNLGAEMSESVAVLVEKEAPEVMASYRQKRLAHQAKVTAKKRAARRKRREAAGAQ